MKQIYYTMNLKKWLQISIFNLMIVAGIGVIMRYKIIFPLEFIDQKKLLHGHSHFAFSGWITQALMAIIISKVGDYRNENLFNKYNTLLFANLLSAYGMLLSFPIQGYGFVSIVFSTMSILVSYIFAILIWKDINKCIKKPIVFRWFKTAVIFNVIASLGVFALVYLIISKSFNQNFYLASVYFFLHFQYNGWFTFTILGLIFQKLEFINLSNKLLSNILYLFTIACIPAYLLSVIWLPLHISVYVIVILCALLQVIGWVLTIIIFYKNRLIIKTNFFSNSMFLIIPSFVALTIKLLLQLGSTIPVLSTLAFGFRPIVVGYLHLVLLGFVSLFILGYAFHESYINQSAKNKMALYIFLIGIILNEIVLMVQGITSIFYVNIMYINETLFAITILMLCGMVFLNSDLLISRSERCGGFENHP